MVIKIIEIVLGLASILLAVCSLLGFRRLSRFWYQIPNLQRYQELFAYMTIFVASFINALILVTMMVVK